MVAAIRVKATMLTRSERTRMAHPLVVHCKRAPHDVYIGRPSKWGNPGATARARR